MMTLWVAVPVLTGDTGCLVALSVIVTKYLVPDTMKERKCQKKK